MAEQIDWDGLVEEAEDSPRAILAEVLARADEITDVVVIFIDKDGASSTWASTTTEDRAIAMLAYSHWAKMKQIYDRFSE